MTVPPRLKPSVSHRAKRQTRNCFIVPSVNGTICGIELFCHRPLPRNLSGVVIAIASRLVGLPEPNCDHRGKADSRSPHCISGRIFQIEN